LYNTDTNIKLFCSNDYLDKNSLEILEKLTHKGIVSHFKKNNVSYFTAAPPKRIIDFIEETKRDFIFNWKSMYIDGKKSEIPVSFIVCAHNQLIHLSLPLANTWLETKV
jgi:hypothetical protein